MMDIPQNVDSMRLAESIESLNKFLNDASVEPLMAALAALKDDPDNEAHLAALIDTFSELGIVQGAVLTYAPYIGFLIDDPFGENK